jgi:putative ABC transport system ATP-binding protein
MTDVAFTWPGRAPFSIQIPHFEVLRGERLMIVGPSGGGKSTFLSLLAGIVVPRRGRVQVLGQDLGSMSGVARDRFRAAHYGIVFQMFNLLPYGSVLDNVLLPLNFSPARKARTRASGGPEAEALRLLQALGLNAAPLLAQPASGLSVGQQQRVAAARALIGSPELIVADEPTSSLDRPRQQAFLDLLFERVAAARATLVMVSHDETLASRFDRVVNLTDIATTSRGGLS